MWMLISLKGFLSFTSTTEIETLSSLLTYNISLWKELAPKFPDSMLARDSAFNIKLFILTNAVFYGDLTPAFFYKSMKS